MQQPVDESGASGIAEEAEAAATVQPHVSIWTLAWVFFRIGATGFGDTGPLLALVERDLVESRKVLTHDDITSNSR